MPTHTTFLNGIPTSKLNLRDALAMADAEAGPLPAGGALNVSPKARSQGSCDSKCTTITLAITLPLLALLGIFGFVLYFIAKRQAKRNEQKRIDEEKNFAMRKLGEGDWASVSDRTEVGSVADGHQRAEVDVRRLSEVENETAEGKGDTREV